MPESNSVGYVCTGNTSIPPTTVAGRILSLSSIVTRSTREVACSFGQIVTIQFHQLESGSKGVDTPTIDERHGQTIDGYATRNIAVTSTEYPKILLHTSMVAGFIDNIKHHGRRAGLGN